MHTLIPLLLFTFLALPACDRSRPPEKLQAPGGQTIIKEFYPNGKLKTVTRLHPDGCLLGILYYNTSGIPTHADYFDDQKRVRRTALYRPDGTPHTVQEFDEQHNLIKEEKLDENGAVIDPKNPQQ